MDLNIDIHSKIENNKKEIQYGFIFHTIKTNVGKQSLKLMDGRFLKTNIEIKIFKRQIVKFSHSYKENIEQII